jgi:hypothetical protein
MGDTMADVISLVHYTTDIDRGSKVTSRNFGRDRRYPVTNAFREEDCKRGATATD